MLKFRKGFSSKIISLVVSISFLSTTTLYAYSGSKDALRVPVGESADRLLGAMREGDRRFNALKELIARANKKAGYNVLQRYVEEQEANMSLLDRRNIRTILSQIGLTFDQIEAIADRIILCELPEGIRLEDRGENPSRIGGLLVSTPEGQKILFPRDRLKFKPYIADLVHDIVELYYREKLVAKEYDPEAATNFAHQFAMKAWTNYKETERVNLADDFAEVVSNLKTVDLPLAAMHDKVDGWFEEGDIVIAGGDNELTSEQKDEGIVVERKSMPVVERLSRLEEPVSATQELVADNASVVSRVVLFLSEKISPIVIPLRFAFPFTVLIIVKALHFDVPLVLYYLMVIILYLPPWINYGFEAVMILPIRMSLTRLIKSDFYKEYYSKSPIERAEFMLERLKTKARQRGDRKVLEVLSVVKGFRAVDRWPVIGDVFHVPTGILDITAGMTEQPAQLQYMIMRRAKDMWFFGQPSYRNRILYYSELYAEVSRFLIRHSAYIGIYAIFELSLVLNGRSWMTFLNNWLGKKEYPLSRLGEAKTKGQNGVLFTIDEAIEVAKRKIIEGKVYTPGEFAEEFYFPEDLARKLLERALRECDQNAALDSEEQADIFHVASSSAVKVVQETDRDRKKVLAKVTYVLYNGNRLFEGKVLVEVRLGEIEKLVKGLGPNERLVIFVTTRERAETIKDRHKLSQYPVCVSNSLPMVVNSDFRGVLKNRHFQREGHLRLLKGYEQLRKYLDEV